MDKVRTGRIMKGRIFVSCKREKHYSRELVLDQHALIHVYAGILEIAYADQLHRFGPGATVIIPCHQLGRLLKLPLNDEPFHSVSVMFPPDMLRKFYASKPVSNVAPQWMGHQEVNPNPLLEGFFQSLIPYFNLQDELPEELAHIKISECLTLLDTYDANVRKILGVLQAPGKVDLAEYMERNFMFNLPLEKFSYLTGRSLTTFKKDFKQIFQTTPGRWLLNKRLERAHYQLAVQKRKPIDVYVDAGFENLAHFSFVFKKQFGYSPTQVEQG